MNVTVGDEVRFDRADGVLVAFYDYLDDIEVHLGVVYKVEAIVRDFGIRDRLYLKGVSRSVIIDPIDRPAVTVLRTKCEYTIWR